MANQTIATVYGVLVSEQNLQKRNLLWYQVNASSRPPNREFCGIEFKVSASQHVSRKRPVGATQQCSQASCQLFRNDRLGKVIIRSCIESLLFFIWSRTSSEHEDRGAAALRAKILANVCTTAIRKHPIENDQIVLMSGHAFFSLTA